MNDRIKTWLYILTSILVVGVVGYLAINLLIFLIPVLVVIYIIFKIKGYVSKKSKPNSKINYEEKHKSSYDSKIDSIDNSHTEVIDVEYEDVNKYN